MNYYAEVQKSKMKITRKFFWDLLSDLPFTYNNGINNAKMLIYVYNFVGKLLIWLYNFNNGLFLG